MLSLMLAVATRPGCGLRSALLLAQRAIIPVGASQLDAAALTDVTHIVDLARDFNPDLRVRVLLTRVDPRTKDAADMLAFLQEQELTALPSMICERVAFRRAIGEGPTVHEIGKDQAEIQTNSSKAPTKHVKSNPNRRRQRSRPHRRR